MQSDEYKRAKERISKAFEQLDKEITRAEALAMADDYIKAQKEDSE